MTPVIHPRRLRETEVKRRLARDDDEYRRLLAQHRDFESRLDELRRRVYLNSQEQVERTNLKKYKLLVKDRMQQLVHQRGADSRGSF